MAQANTPNPPERVSKTAFMVILWGGLLISLLFFAFRITVRLRGFRRLFWDDALVLGAWLMLLANAIIWQYAKAGQYDLSMPVLPPNFLQEVQQYLHLSVAVTILFYTCVWSVKLSFLVLFRRLGKNVERQKAIWWVVTVFVAAGFVVVVGIIQWDCLIPSFETVAVTCSAPAAVQYERNILKASCSIDIVTDVAIMLIPLNMLWKVQMRMRQKLGLACIFGLTVIIMIIAIIRVTIVGSNEDQVDGAWLWTWSSVEQTTAIVVACLSSIRALFTRPDRSRQIPEEANGAEGKRPLNNRRTKPSAALRQLETTTSGTGSDHGSYELDDSTLSTQNLVMVPQDAPVANEKSSIQRVQDPSIIV